MYRYFKKPFPHNAHTDKLLTPARTAAQELAGTTIQALPYSLYKLYHTTGSRVEYEAVYMAHRRRLNLFTVMTLYEDDSRWLGELEDILWAVCDEYTWALPAHVAQNASAYNAIRELDLFATETGGALAEVLELLGDRLSPEVFNRVEYELRRRIITPFLTREHRQYGKSNWAAVCAGNAATVVMRLGTHDEAMDAIAHADEIMELFLESYNDDGCCLEGPLYWSYGFGYFCFYADMARDYTNGAVNWFTNPKVRTIAEFRNKFYLKDQYVIPFADSSHELTHHTGLAHFLAQEYETVRVPDERFELCFDDDPRHRFFDLLRDFYWYDETLTPDSQASDAAYDLPDAQWFIRKHNGLCFVAKGGHNGEPHNHIDVGSFILFDNGSFILDDLGWPEYTKTYFGSTRDAHLCAGAHGHSIPTVENHAQLRGRVHAGKCISMTPEHFELDLTGTYELPGVGVIRAFDFDGGQLRITDTFTGCCGKELRERFVTRFEPVRESNCVSIKDWTLTCDTPCTVEVSSDTFEPRLSVVKQNMKPVETAYLMDFVFTPGSDTCSVTFTLRRCDACDM